MGKIATKLNHSDLFNYFQFIRLQTDKNICEQKLKENEKVVGNNLTFKDKLSNMMKTAKTNINNYNSKNNTAAENLNDFYNSYPYFSVYTIGSIDNYFISDNKELEKLIFATTIILDNRFKYVYHSEGLKEVSKLLYDNPFTLENIEKELEENYKFINHKSLSNVQKGLLIGVALTSLAAVIVCPLLGAGGANASAAVTTAALAAHGFGDMQIGIGMLALNSLIFGSVTTGITYASLNAHNKELAKKEFRNLDCDEESMYLSIQCLCINFLKKSLNEIEFKNTLDETLKNMDILRSDLIYLLFVENENISTNKTKLESFNRFEQRLMKVLDI